MAEKEEENIQRRDRKKTNGKYHHHHRAVDVKQMLSPGKIVNQSTPQRVPLPNCNPPDLDKREVAQKQDQSSGAV